MIKRQRIFGLDVVRATAILFVLISHIHYVLDNKNPILLALSGLFGYFGIELFFVLSGFLIGSILLKQYQKTTFSTTELYTFLKRRWYRTLPTYFLVLCLNLIIAQQLNIPHNEWWKYFLFIQNFKNYSISFFPESWSLSIEEWSYLFTSGFLFLFWKIFKNKKWSFLFIIIFLICLAHGVRYHNYITNNSILNPTIWNTEIKSVVILRLDAILYGFLVAWSSYFYNTTIKKHKNHLFIIAILLFILQFIVLNILGFNYTTTPKYFKIFYFTLTAITIMFTFPIFIHWKKASSFIKQPITFISKTSYSIYLLHYSIIAVLIQHYLTYKLNSISLLIIYFSTTIFFSFLLYTFYEKPMMDIRDKHI